MLRNTKPIQEIDLEYECSTDGLRRVRARAVSNISSPGQPWFYSERRVPEMPVHVGHQTQAGRVNGGQKARLNGGGPL